MARKRTIDYRDVPLEERYSDAALKAWITAHPKIVFALLRSHFTYDWGGATDKCPAADFIPELRLYRPCNHAVVKRKGAEYCKWHDGRVTRGGSPGEHAGGAADPIIDGASGLG